MFWKKEGSKRAFQVNMKAYPEMMAVPFLFGAWLFDPEWHGMLESVDEYPGPPAAVLFFGNYMMIRFYLIDDESSGEAKPKTVVTQHMYQTRDGGVMMKSDLVEGDTADGTQWSEAAEFKWWVTQDLGLMLEHQGEGLSWDRFKPASLPALFEAGFHRGTIEQLVRDYPAGGAGFIETFTVERADQFIDERFEAEADGRDRPSPPVE